MYMHDVVYWVLSGSGIGPGGPLVGCLVAEWAQ